MFNATLAGHHHHHGHHLRSDYLHGSRGGSRAGSRFDLHEAGNSSVLATELEVRVNMLQESQSQKKSCCSKYQACLYLSVVFSIIAATIIVIIYVALGGLRGGGIRH